MRKIFTAAILLIVANTAHAGPVQNPIAIFAGLDKITGTITTFEIKVGQTKRFGSLNVTPRICNTRPITEEPKTTSFIEVDENTLDGKLKRIFTGWMLAQSPGLNALEHPVYDIWLTGCRNPDAPKNDITDLPPAADEKKPKAAN
ncbi:MAG TPA: DUF2155 domain-containing protein [Rhizobiales bacterium]|nr:DUF2155 domain-containing protein [Hyphomicrobiales bacterium]